MALIDNLKLAYRFTETSGSTTADEGPDGNTGTLAASAALGSGRITFGAAADRVALATQLTLSADWSIAFRGKQDADGTAGVICGNRSSNNAFLFFNGTGNEFRVQIGATAHNFLGAGATYTSDANYGVTYSAGALSLYKNGVLIETKSVAGGTFIVTHVGTGFTNDSFGLVGSLDYFYVWERALIATEFAELHNDPDAFLNGGEVPASISITSPVSRYVFQRSGDIAGVGGSAVVDIDGEHEGATAIEVSTDNVNWSTLDASPNAGTYSGSVTLAAGTRTIYVRQANEAAVVATVANIGVGDRVGLYGQSNVEGQGITNQSYMSVNGQIASKFTNGTTWANLTDPVNPQAEGSPWPLLATLWMAHTKCPVAFLPYGVSGSPIWTFVPGQAHYTTFTNAIDAIGGVRCTLWWQGETDAIAGMSAATYNSHLDSIANDLASRYSGHLLLPARLQNSTGIADANEEAIRAAVDLAVSDNPNVKAGPDLSDITTDDAYHPTSLPKLTVIAARFWTAAYKALFHQGGSVIGSTVIVQGTVIGVP